MTDIVARLRDHKNYSPLHHEAATEIERLNAVINGIVEKGMDDLTMVAAFQVNEELRAEIEQLRAENKRLRGWIAPDILELTDEMERLRAALRGALSMVDSFASGSGFSHSGRTEYESYRRALEPNP